jgi:hypothetical protein
MLDHLSPQGVTMHSQATNKETDTFKEWKNTIENTHEKES